MRRVIIIAYSAILAILLLNFFYYNSLYKKQIDYIVTLLNRQVQIVGIAVDSTNNNFVSDLTKVNFSAELSQFFDKTKPEVESRLMVPLTLFYSRYRDFVTRIRIYDTNMYEFVLSYDEIKSQNRYLRL